MSQYSWTFENAAGASLSLPQAATSFPTQADAEAWFGETWQQLAEDGVAAATLMRDQSVVYGPMSLEPPQS